MATARRVLIADPELQSVRALSKALRARGYNVTYVNDGSKALEVAVMRHPEVILFDEGCRQLDARSFIQIISSNPRTSDIPTLITSAERDTEHLRFAREGVLRKPFNLDEVLSRIDHLCRRSEAARELKGDAREIEGALAQLPLSDLLQILAMNRRTGRLVLGRAMLRGEIHLSEGRPINARTGEVEGEKALFRLLGWKEGSFSFSPGAPARKRIDRAMEDALLEGARQSDERDRLAAALPPLGARLAVDPNLSDPVEPHPITAEVLGLLKQPRRLLEVMDLSQSPDLEVMSAVAALLERGLVRVDTTAAAVEGPVLGPAEVHALRGKLLLGRLPRASVVAKVLLCASGARGARWFLRNLPGLMGVATEPGCLRSGFGTLGRLEVGESLFIDFVLVPAAEAARPLWRPFLNGAIGAVLMEESEPALKLARYAGFELRLPVVVAAAGASGGLIVGDAVPPTLKGAPAGVTVVSHTLTEAVRALLLAALQPPVPQPPEGLLQRVPGVGFS